jgi:phosphopantetheinyl transferase
MFGNSWLSLDSASPERQRCRPRAFMSCGALENYSLLAMGITLQGMKQSVWIVSITEALDLIDLRQVLTDAELARARSFRIPEARDRFLAGRAFLRCLLTRRTGGMIPAWSWRFKEGSHGKPLMDDGFPAFQFNLSHSGNCVAVAIAESHPLGVDLESIASEDCVESIPDVLTAGELKHLARYEGQRQKIEFAKIWTIKEACGKALGFGASFDFCRIDVDFNNAEPKITDLSKPAQEFGVASMAVRCAGRPYILSLVTAKTPKFAS